MRNKTTSVSFGRAQVPLVLGNRLNALAPGLRGRVIKFILAAHSEGLDLPKLIDAIAEFKRMGVLLNQSLRASYGQSVDPETLQMAVKKVNNLFP